MKAYKLKTAITGDGKIVLPETLKNLYAHKVELTLLDLEAESSSHLRSVNILSDITNQYHQIDEEDIDISEIYKEREKIDGRGISFD